MRWWAWLLTAKRKPVFDCVWQEHVGNEMLPKLCPCRNAYDHGTIALHLRDQ